MISIIKRIKQYDHKIVEFIITDMIIMLFSLLPVVISPMLYEKFIDECLLGKNAKVLIYVILMYLAMWFFGSLISAIRNCFENGKYKKLKLVIARDLFNRGIHTSHHISSSDIKDRTESDIYCNVFSKIIIEKIYGIIILAGCLVMMFKLNIWFTLMAMFSIPIAKILLKLAQKKLILYSHEYRNQFIKYEKWLVSSVSLRDQIKSNNNESYMEKIFDKYWIKLAFTYMRKQIHFAIQYCLNEFKDTYVIKLNLYFLGFYLIARGQISVGLLLAFMKYYEKCVLTYANINELNSTFETYKPYLKKVDELQEQVIYDARKKNIAYKDQSVAIELKNVSFSYGNQLIIKNMNATIYRGSHVVISGQSGIGKTTLLNLIAGVNKSYEGDIYICNTSINELGYGELSEIRSVVQQNPYFFKISIWDNFRLANSRMSLEQIISLCKSIGCDDFIRESEDGYNTVVDNNFSYGQLQRLAIARAIIQDTEIMLLDEPTSALDKTNELVFLNYVINHCVNKTVIIISHTIKENGLVELKM